MAFEDRVMGRIEQDVAAEVGDFVLRRRDGLFAYQLAVVVDDADQAITDVVRGADLLLSTPRQIVLQRSLALSTPRYLHVPVAAHADGRKLSKQTQAAPVDPARPREGLARALRFLRQPVEDAASPAELLAAAVKSWQIKAIPRLVAVPVE
jgi:glutamyl-Q tRNA(Asp) synthetase